MPDAFRFEGLEAFEKALKGFAQVVEQDVTRYVKTIAHQITFNLVMESPQWSGAAASAWRVGVGSPVIVDVKPDLDGLTIYSRRNRNMEAVNAAMSEAAAEIRGYRLEYGSVYILNGLEYAQSFPSGRAGDQALRVVNLPQRGVKLAVLDSLSMMSALKA